MKIVINNLNNNGVIKNCIKRTDRYRGRVQESITLDIDTTGVEVRICSELGSEYNLVPLVNGDIVVVEVK
jgi:hypothetical protein